MDFDPNRKWGLLPKPGKSSRATKVSSSLGGGTTYILPGDVVSFDSGAQRCNVIGRSMGHSRRTKDQGPKDSQQEVEMARLMQRDGGQSHGMKTLMKARKTSTQWEGSAKMQPKILTNKSVDATIIKQDTIRPFSTSAIRRIGFDPSRTTEVHVKANNQIVSQSQDPSS